MPEHLYNIYYPGHIFSARFSIDETQDFLRFLQYEEFLAYVIMKADFLYHLLEKNQVESGRKEVLENVARILGPSEVSSKSQT